jgi:hypothetical protein
MKRSEAYGYGAVMLAVLGVSGLIGVLVRKSRSDMPSAGDASDAAPHASSDKQTKSAKSVVTSRDICFVKVHVNVSVHSDHSLRTKAGG